VPLAGLGRSGFGAWDIFPDSAYEAAMHAGVLERTCLPNQTGAPENKPMSAVFDQSYVKRLSGDNVKEGKNKFELAEQLIADIAEFKRRINARGLVMFEAASTEGF